MKKLIVILSIGLVLSIALNIYLLRDNNSANKENKELVNELKSNQSKIDQAINRVDELKDSVNTYKSEIEYKDVKIASLERDKKILLSRKYTPSKNIDSSIVELNKNLGDSLKAIVNQEDTVVMIRMKQIDTINAAFFAVNNLKEINKLNEEIISQFKLEKRDYESALTAQDEAMLELEKVIELQKNNYNLQKDIHNNEINKIKKERNIFIGTTAGSLVVIGLMLL